MNDITFKVILGSSSKWRKEVLEQILLEMPEFKNKKFETISPDIDEKAIRDQNPSQLTLKIARAKAKAVLEKIPKGCLLITSDQVIVCNGVIREKPETIEECKQFLRSYKDYAAEAITSVVVTNTSNGTILEGVDTAKQYFHPIPEEFMDELIQQGDVMYCCGGFTIEHMEKYLKDREGETETMTGLPKSLTKKLLRQAMQSESDGI